jgi:plasmid maintenance system antidote protein VapI
MNYETPNHNVILNTRGLLGIRRESIEKLSAATGISLSTLKRRLLGKSKFTLDEVSKLSEHFGVSVQFIVSSPAMQKSVEVEETHN